MLTSGGRRPQRAATTKGRSVGERAPYFELPDQQDYPWSLSGQLEMGPVVLVFYRGDWCPYCNGQLASYARNYGEFERRGAQLAGVSVDPPRHNARMVGKLLTPFPLLSDPRGEVARAYGLWNEEEGVAVPAVVVVSRSGEVSHLYAGSDAADRPTDGELFAALDRLRERSVRIERNTGGPELRTTAAEARDGSVRPDRTVLELDELLVHHRGVLSASGIFSGRFGGWGRPGRNAFGEVGRYEDLLRGYDRAVRETVRLQREGA